MLTIRLCQGLALASMLLMTASPSPIFAETERADLSGVWILDEELSEDPMEKMRESRRSGGGMSGGMGGGGRGGGTSGGGRGGGGMSGGGRGGGTQGGESPEGMRGRMGRMREAVKQLTIVHADPALSITTADGRERVLSTDGKKTGFETAMGSGEVWAKWKGEARLVVSMVVDDRESKEIYELTAGGEMLKVTVKTAGMGPMGSVEFTRIYRPAEETAPTD